MCGIALACTAYQPVKESQKDDSAPILDRKYDGNTSTYNCELAAPLLDFLVGLRARGPDHIGMQSVLTAGSECLMTFTASLLQLRGLQPGASPCTSSDGHVLCFNGEVFGGLDVQPGQNDGARLLAALSSDNSGNSSCGSTAGVPEVLSRIRGPWALIYWAPLHQRLWLGRDVLGRRSLLVHFPDAADPRLLLTSVSPLPPPAAPTEAVAAPLAGAAERTDGAAAGAAAGAGPGAGAGGGGEEGEDAEPSGTDGYWVELPPGLYSISFSSAAEDGSEADGADVENVRQAAVAVGSLAVDGAVEAGLAATAEVTAAAEAVGAAFLASPPLPRHPAEAILVTEDGAPEVCVAPAHAAVPFRRFAMGAVQCTMVRHAWRDPLLLQLESYRRVETLAGVPPAEEGCLAGGAAAATAAAVTAVGARAVTADNAASSVPVLVRDGQQQQQDGELAIGGSSRAVAEVGVLEAGDTKVVERSGQELSPWVGCMPSTPDDAANALLNVLLAAVRVRCTAIEARSPHPAFAYAQTAIAAASAASAAGTAVCSLQHSSPAPQPSWRASDPLSFAVSHAQPGLTSCVAAASDPRVSPSGIGESIGGADPPCNGSSSGIGRMSSSSSSSGLPMAPVMILFSGGVDSVLLAALAHKALPPGVPIDLSNVCFAGGTSPDRLAARSALEELSAACPGRPWHLIEVDAVLQDVDRHRSRLLALLRPAHTVMDLNIGAALWLAVSGQGTLHLPSSSSSTSAAATATPAEANNRQQGRQVQLQDQQQQQPTDGMETVSASLEGRFYGSPARVVLLGHGADEQCGGYGRHRTRFRSDGWRGLAGELEVDVRRLWLRNLGRDDRLVSDWGREARHPFLDEDVMQLLLRMPLDCILDLHQPPGKGDKSVLRRALQLLGLPQAAARVKRAIQFGSRIGKMSNRRDFGSNRAANKKNAGGVALQDVSRAAAEAAAAAWVKEAKVKPPRCE